MPGRPRRHSHDEELEERRTEPCNDDRPDSTRPFALARFRDGGAVALGLVAGDRIRRLSADELGAAGLNAFLAAPDWDRLAALAKDEDGWMPLADVTLTAPVEPRQVLQTGANYRQHVIELVAAGSHRTATARPTRSCGSSRRR